MSGPPLVSVVIPVFNGEETLTDTLRSVSAQTYPRLEILVIDDGSTDGTLECVREQARKDRRIVVLRQPNGGVAAARNRGIAEAAGELIAPIDADDLWLPDKIEKQVAALQRAGTAGVLCYTWSALIDAAGRVRDAAPGPIYAADALWAICRGNFVGNGSAVLMRKSAVTTVGGYDPSLRAQSAQGCEDFLLYFRLARIGPFAVVPEHLTRYRRRRGSMSSDARRMLRSWLLVRDEICREYPASAPALVSNLASYLTWLYRNAIGAGRIGDAAFAAAQLARINPRRALATVVRGSLGAAMRPVA